MESLKYLFGFEIRRAFNENEKFKDVYLSENGNNFCDFVKKRCEFISNFNNFFDKPEKKTKDISDLKEIKDNSIIIDLQNCSNISDKSKSDIGESQQEKKFL